MYFAQATPAEERPTRPATKVRILSDVLLDCPKELATCNPKLRQLSASRGVRSRQETATTAAAMDAADLFAPVKVETIPLLSPTMEYELMLREPWQPREPAAVAAPARPGPAAQLLHHHIATPAAGTAPAATPFSAWEENFQDLSSWCMANAQARCDFPAGESAMAANKLTGTRNEGGDVLTAVEGATGGLMQAIGRKAVTSGGDTIVGARRPEPVTCVIEPQQDHAYILTGQEQQQQQQTFFNNNNNNSSSSNNKNNINFRTSIINDGNDLRSSGNTWLGQPLKDKPTTTAATSNSNTIAWQELCDLGITVAPKGLPLYQQQSPVVDIEPKLEPQLQPKDNQDVFQALETDASNGFDLLSYLCEDDIPSPGDSVSTCSSRVTDVNGLARLQSNSSAHIVVSPRTYEPISLSTSTPTDSIRSHLLAASTADSPYSHESPKHSPISSASSDVTIPTRSSYRQLRTIIKVEKPETPPPMTERRTTRPRRTRTSSTTSRASSSTSRTGRGKKRVLEEDSDSDDEGYREVREKNNEASRKSRMNKKAKEVEMSKRSLELEKDNRILKMKVEELEKLVSSMRNALLRSALKREVKPNMF